MNNLIKRIITGVFIIVFMLAVILISRDTLLIALLVFSNIAIYELNFPLKKIGFNSYEYLAYVSNSVTMISSYFFNHDFLIYFSSIYCMILMIITMFKDEKIDRAFSNLFMFLYLTVPYYFLSNMSHYMWVMLSFGIASGTDTFAYVFGMTIGKHKLAEKLSPKKTVEGAIGGIIGALIISFVFINLFKLENAMIIYVFSVLASIFSQMGDLAASFIKRKAGIKDYGFIFIGHGGVMDRFDSILFIAPLVYLLIRFI